MSLRFWPERAPNETDGRLADLARREAASVDVDAFAKWVLMHRPNHAAETPYRGIGCTAVEVPSVEPVEPEPRTSAEAASALRRAMERAVARAIGDAKRVAVLAGGGVDSSGLLALAVDAMRARGGSAFAVALDYAAEGDDRPHLRALEAHLACDVVRVAPEEGARHAHVLEGIDGSPCTSTTGAMEIAASARAREEGAEIILSGAGGDDLFDGDPTTFSELVLAGDPRSALGAARAVRNVWGAPRRRSWPWVIRPTLVRFVPRAIRLYRAHRPRPFPAWAGPALRRSIEETRRRRAGELERELRGELLPEREPTELTHVSWAWHRHQLTVGAGLRRVDPWLDRGVVAVLHRLPQRWLFHGGVRRGLFREAIRGLVPEAQRMRTDKAAFEPAIVRCVERTSGFGPLRELARCAHLAEMGLVEPGPLLEEWDALARSPVESLGWHSLWPVLACEAFLRAREARR